MDCDATAVHLSDPLSEGMRKMRNAADYFLFSVFIACGSLVGCSETSDKQHACIVKPEMFCAPFAMLREHIPPIELKRLKESQETDLVNFHLAAGMYVRNSVHLWEDNDVTKYFRANGVTETDMMSYIMLVALIDDLNNRPVDMSGITKRVVAHLQPPPPPPPKKAGTSDANGSPTPAK